MSISQTKTLLACAVLPIVSGYSFAADPPALVHNPFSRPDSERTLVGRPALPDGDVSPQTLDLRATMVYGDEKLANIGGKIHRPGDEIGNHLLTRVFEDRAVFERDGEQIVVFVKPELVDEDE